jgi:hypothetical protein
LLSQRSGAWFHAVAAEFADDDESLSDLLVLGVEVVLNHSAGFTRRALCINITSPYHVSS